MTLRFTFSVYASFFGAFAAIFALNAVTASTALLSNFYMATLPEMSKATSIYLIAEIALMPTIPIWLKLVTLKRLLNFSGAGFILSSLAAFSMTDADGFVIARAFQGAFGGLLLPLPYLFIKSDVAPEQQKSAISIFTTLTITAPILGPMVALSLPVSHVSWLFTLVAVFTLPCLLVASQKKEKREGPFLLSNLFGFILLCVGLGLFVWAVEHIQLWGGLSNQTFRTFTFSSLTLIVAGLIWQSAQNTPLFDLRLFKYIESAFVLFMSMLMGVVVYGLLYLIPYYLITVHSASPSTIFKVILYAAIPQILLLPVLLWLRDKLPAYMLISTSFFVLGVMSLILSYMGVDHGPQQMLNPQLLRAAGISLLVLPLSLIMLNAAPSHLHNSMSTLYSFFRTLGGALSIACISAYINFRANTYRLDNLAYGQPDNTLEALSYVYAFNDAFGYLSYALLFCCGLSIMMGFQLHKRRSK